MFLLLMQLTVSLTEIVKQVRDGILWVLDYALERGAPVVLCGHSVGAQLTFMALASPAAQSRCSPVSTRHNLSDAGMRIH